MKLVCISSLLLALTGFAKASQSAQQSPIAITGPGEISLSLTALSSESFTTFSHPAYPGKSARVKKSDFCDGTVASYTGYIDIGPKHLFFYFFESRNNPDSDDVLLWTNGGPGSSSSLGLFMELGPCTIASPNSTKYNPNSWNSNANIFFIDQPLDVGFSYSDFNDIPYNTEEAGLDIATFVAMFFETFDRFKGRNFHLTGESYAGRYLPVYASIIYDQNMALVDKGYLPINLKSVMIGNGATDFSYLFQSYYDMQCTGASLDPVQSISTCIRMKQILPRCAKQHKESCVDHHDLMDCRAVFNFCSSELIAPIYTIGYNVYDLSMKCDEDDCYPEQQFINEYLNSQDVRTVLGIDPEFGEYKAYSDIVGYIFNENGDPLHQNQFYIAELLARGVKVLIYAGTYDFICNWVGNEKWTLEMEWEGREAFAATPLRDWDVEGIAAGKTRSFGNFSFATIYGAGHLVPHDKPVESLEMLNRWLADKEF